MSENRSGGFQPTIMLTAAGSRRYNMAIATFM
jgi:hypothetical protein